MYDLAILGGGPAGVAAGVYASRKRLKTIFITQAWGGQSIDSVGIENWIGTINIPGPKFAEDLKKHLMAYAGNIVNVKEGESITRLTVGNEEAGTFKIETDQGSYEAKTVLIATGSSRRKLAVPGAAEFENKGITYCASCDGPLFADKDVVVIGGGNAAFETAAQLLAYCKTVTLINRSDEFKADPVTVEKVLANSKMKALKNVELLNIKGDKFVNGIVYKDVLTQDVKNLPAEGVFVEIGLIPNTSFAKELVELNTYGQIVIDPRTQATKVSGIWAAGDATDVLYHQNNIAAGDAVRALEDIYMHLHVK
jgi:alkyl hydroperoxide reductase subunit F